MKKINYVCNVPENEQPYLIYDEVTIDNFIAEYDDCSIEQWFISLFNCGYLVLQTITPLRSFRECLIFLAAVESGTLQSVGKCGLF